MKRVRTPKWSVRGADTCRPPQSKTPSAKLTSENRGASASQTHEHALRRASANLLLEHFFDLPDFFLNFAGVFFSIAFGL